MTLTQEVKRIVPSRLDEKAKKVYNRLKDETDNFDVDVLVIFPELATAVEEFIEVIKKKYPEAIKKTKPAETPPPPPPAPDSDDKEVLEAMRDYRISELKAKRLIELRNEASESKKESIDKMLETLKKSEFYDTRYTSKRNIDKNRTRDVKKDSNRGSLTAKDELNMTGRRYKRISKAGHKNQYGTTEGGKVYYEYRANRRDIDHKIKMAKGGGVEESTFKYYKVPNEQIWAIQECNKSFDDGFGSTCVVIGSKKSESEAIKEVERLNSKKYVKGGRVEVVLDEGNGKVLNDIYNMWNNVKTEQEYKKWVEKVKNTKFGTYGTISFEEVMEKFNFDNAPINSFHLKTFKEELKNALSNTEFGNGGGVEGRFKKHFKKGGRIDLFEDYENIPPKIQKILDFYEDDFQDGRYDGLSKALKEVEANGYTFEYYLDGVAYGLRPKNVPLNHIKGYEEYSKGGGVKGYYFEVEKENNKFSVYFYKPNGDLDWGKQGFSSKKEAQTYGEENIKKYQTNYPKPNLNYEAPRYFDDSTFNYDNWRRTDKMAKGDVIKSGGVGALSEEDARKELEKLKSEGKITLSVGNHGLIFMQIVKTGNAMVSSFKQSYESYLDALKHYYRVINRFKEGGGVDSGAVKGRFKKHFAKGGWVLYDEDTQKEIKTYKTESEARKDLYEYEGNGNIVKKSVWDKSIEPKVDRFMFEEEMYEYERGGLIDADLYYDMLGAVPPLYISELNGEKQMDNNTFAVGEAYDYTDTPDGYKATYQAYSKKGNLFFDEGLIYFTSRGIAKSVEPKIDRFMFEDEMYEYGKGGMINGKYLDNISTAKKQEILTNIARHYGITNAEAEKEVRDSEAEMLYEYISNNPSLRMEVFRGIEK